MGHGVGQSLVVTLLIAAFPISCLVVAAMRVLVPAPPRAAPANQPAPTVQLAMWERCTLRTRVKAQECGAVRQAAVGKSVVVSLNDRAVRVHARMSKREIRAPCLVVQISMGVMRPLHVMWNGPGENLGVVGPQNFRHADQAVPRHCLSPGPWGPAPRGLRG